MTKGVYQHGKRWRVDTRVRGEQCRKSFPSRGEAEQFLAAVRAGAVAVEQRMLADQGDLTVSAALEDYAALHRAPAHHVARLRAAFGGLPAAAIRTDHGLTYSRDRQTQGAAAKTAWNELVVLRAALRFAWDCDKLPAPPRLKLRKPVSVRRRVAWEQEAKTLLGAADLPLRRLLLGCYVLGLRRGEALEARWEWLHGNVLLIPTTKNGDPKAVQLPDGLLAMLRLAPVHPVYLWCKWHSGNGKGRTWPGRWYPSTLQRAWSRLLVQCGVTDLHIHDLRRSMSSVAQARGHAMAAVRELGGWRDETTMRRHYSHARAGAAAGVADDLMAAVAPRLEACK